MKPYWLAALPLLTLAALVYRAPLLSGSPLPGVANAASLPVVPGPDVDRSPTDLALTADGKWAITANATSDTVSLVDLKTGEVLSEVPVGKRPFAVVLTPDGTRALVTNSWGNSVTILAVEGTRLRVVQTVPVGDEPRGIAISKDGARAFVALAGAESVAVLDVKAGTVAVRWPVGWEPWHVALTPDGKTLAVGNTRSRTVSVLDSTTGAEKYTVRTLGRNLRHLAVSPDGLWAYVPGIAERGMGVTKGNIDRGWVVGNRLIRIPLSQEGARETLTLDTFANAVGDVDGCAFTPDGQMLALTAGGTHEVLLLAADDLPFAGYGGSGDHIDPGLRTNPRRFRRIRVGGRPLGATFTPDGKTLVVANYLKNAIQTVNVENGAVLKNIPLGGPDTPSLARRGEAIFTDADRSFHNWYSCNTCHPDGGTNGGSFDTLNDGGFGKPKKTLSLRGLAETAPYTWHGWNKDLRNALHESLLKTMQGPEPTDADLDAVEAYVRTLEFRPSPFRNPDGTLTAVAKRGEAVFNEKGCASCHPAPNFTAPIVVTTGLESQTDVYQGFNPPSLRGVYSRAPYLHDGRAQTLEEVLTRYHQPSKLTGQPDPTPAELVDLIAYLKSL